MNPDQEQKLNELYEFMLKLRSSSTIPFEVDAAFHDRLSDLTPNLPDGFENAPLSAITAPTGGATQDAEARTAINSIITRLEDLGLVAAN